MYFHFNKFNIFCNNLNKYNSSNDNSNMYCDIYNAIPINTSTKSEGKIYVPEPSISILGFIQPQYLIERIQSENDPCGLFNRFFIFAPNVAFPSLEDRKKITRENQFKLSQIY